MNITKAQIKIQFNRAKKLGWLPFFAEAEKAWTRTYFDTADLLAIGSRETNLDPKYLTKTGDNGNGFGLLQIDIRSYPAWIKSGGWTDAREGILKGASVLMQKWTDYETNIGKRLTVKSSKSGTTYRYTAQKANDADAQRLVISSYNCGRWSQYALASGQDIDKYSTGGDYAKDVMERARIFRSLLKQDSLSTDKDGLASSNSLSATAGDAVETRADEPQDDSAQENISGTDERTHNSFDSGEKLSPAPAPDSNTVEVEQVKPETQPEKQDWGIKASVAAAVTFITTSGAGVFAVMREAKTEIIYGFFGAATVVGIVFIIARFVYITKREKRESIEKMAREQRAADLQLALVNTA
ncbi:MAG TPA: hypothetical protein VNI84_15715, partial [Pyrinomonadaceae bacterium]|nr:hypothetical protein [Pyrinomonadaceae bacterium]